jgi:hypothetical protein
MWKGKQDKVRFKENKGGPGKDRGSDHAPSSSEQMMGNPWKDIVC